MTLITKESVDAAHDYRGKRICFGNDTFAHLRWPKDQRNYDFGTINLPFRHGVENSIPVTLRHNTRDKDHPDAGWIWFDSAEQRQSVEGWCRQCGDSIFLYDCLSSSLALAYTFRSEGAATTRIEFGAYEYEAKQNGCVTSIEAIAQRMSDLIKFLPPYREANLICGVPKQHGKEFHLPEELAERVATGVGKPDITKHFWFGSHKVSLKNLSINDKWDALENSGFETGYGPNALDGQSAILIDDKYQSGITIQYVASKLQQLGASRVLGLCAVKTWRDDDNAS